jgi:hypothetical protein
MAHTPEEKKWLAELERRKLKAIEAEKQRHEESLVMPMTLFFSKIFQSPLKSFQNPIKSKKRKKQLMIKRRNSEEDELLVEKYKEAREQALSNANLDNSDNTDFVHLLETMNRLKPEDSARPYTRGPR